MSLLKIITFPDDRLRLRAEPVADVDDEINALAGDMLETMYDSGGIGLAGIQVGIRKRIFVMDLSPEQKQPMCLINPEILDKSGTERMREGCLSVPEYYADIERAEKILLRAQTLEGKTIEQECDGLMAVCVQHETDHLDGKLFTDYMSPLKRQRFIKFMRRQQQLTA